MEISNAKRTSKSTSIMQNNKKPDTYFWAKTTPNGKPGISVYDHMVNVGCVAHAIAKIHQKILQRSNLSPNSLSALAALHDLGKISPGFQQKCKEWLRESHLEKVPIRWDTLEKDHGRVTHASVQNFFIENGMDREIASYLATILGAHHGKIQSPPNQRGITVADAETKSGILWADERQLATKKIWQKFKVANAQLKLDTESPDDSSLIWWLAGLTSVADWIGSDERFFSPARDSHNEDKSAIAQKALYTIGLIPPSLKHDLSFEEIFGFPPNEMQTKALQTITGPGVYVIEAPMGMGKTEAALAVAYQLMITEKAQGIYFALPTQATSNRIHLRMDKFLEKITTDPAKSRLIHGNSWLMQSEPDLQPTPTSQQTKAEENEDAMQGRDWFASAKKALITPFGVGTIDQALLGVVAAKHFFVRRFALAGKVVILDEIHSYDIYTGTLIKELITTLEGLGCTVIILSATLTAKRLNKLIDYKQNSGEPKLDYPLISGRSENQPIMSVSIESPKPKTVKVEFITTENAMNEAIAVAKNGGAVLWICNTVATAQEQYQRFKADIQKDFPIGLLHARFPFWRREELEKEWMERFGKEGKTRCGSILVSTQIVEQSVDLDADLLITELAPTDMLLQRLGRLWRHERGLRPVKQPSICILNENASITDLKKMTPQEIKNSLGKKAKVYAPYILLRSLVVWQNLKKISIPHQIRDLLKATYEVQEDEPQFWQELANQWFATDSAKKMIANRNRNIWQVALEDEEGVQTRINENPTVDLILYRKLADSRVKFIDDTSVLNDDNYCLSTAQALHRNLVKIPRYCFDQVVQPKYFNEYFKREYIFGRVNSDGTIIIKKGLKSDARLSYSDEIGLLIKHS